MVPTSAVRGGGSDGKPDIRGDSVEDPDVRGNFNGVPGLGGTLKGNLM